MEILNDPHRIHRADVFWCDEDPNEQPKPIREGKNAAERDTRMIPDRDIWRAANLLIREHKVEAEVVAARLADEMLERGERTRLPSDQARDRRVAGCAHGEAELA
jgi:hypothetical protein